MNFLDVISVRNCNGVVDSSNWMQISDSLIPMFGVWSLEIERVTLVDSNLGFFWFMLQLIGANTSKIWLLLLMGLSLKLSIMGSPEMQFSIFSWFVSLKT